MDPIAGSDLSRPYSSHEDPTGIYQAGARSAASNSRGRLHNMVLQIAIHVVDFLSAACVVLL